MTEEKLPQKVNLLGFDAEGLKKFVKISERSLSVRNSLSVGFIAAEHAIFLK